MKLTAGQAAIQTGKSVPTIVRAYKKGTLSGEKLPDGGGYQFEASELFRVFPPVTRHSDGETTPLDSETPNDTRPLQVEVEILRERLRILETERERERNQLVGQVDDLRQDRDHWREQAERATRLIAPPAETPVSAAPAVGDRGKRRWWLFGRAND